MNLLRLKIEILWKMVQFLFFPFKVFRNDLIFSTISLILFFLWDSTNMPHIAYQSIQEKKLYYFSFRLIDIRLRAQLPQGKNLKKLTYYKKEKINRELYPDIGYCLIEISARNTESNMRMIRNNFHL